MQALCVFFCILSLQICVLCMPIARQILASLNLSTRCYMRHAHTQ